MKIFTLTTICLIIHLGVFSEGIKFRQGTWQEILAASQAENKMVVTDFSTVWCGVCRMMEKKVFTDPKVADFFNTNFICYQLDAEKGEGKHIANQYEISSFPTFLFVDKTGNMIYKAIGYMESNQFIAEAQVALRELRTNTKNLGEWEKEYSRKKNNPASVLKYLKHLEKLKLDYADVLDQFCRISREKNLKKTDFLQFITNSNTCINAGGPCYNFISTHFPELYPLIGCTEEDLLNSFEEAVMDYSMKKAIQQKNDTLFFSLLKTKSFFNTRQPEDTLLATLKLKCQYYAGIRNTKAYEPLAIQLAEYIQKDKEELQKSDSLAYTTFLTALVIAPQKLDSLVSDFNLAGTPLSANILDDALRNLSHQHISQLTYDLCDLAHQAIQVADNPEFRQQILFWAIEAVALYDHFGNSAVLAEVMYATGQRQQAIEWMKKARRKAIHTMNSTDGYAAQIQKKIEKMEAGIPL